MGRGLLRSRILLSLTLVCVLRAPSVCLSQSVSSSPAVGRDAEELSKMDRVPIPDPTRLTSVALREAVIALKDVIYARLDAAEKALGAVKDVIYTRLEGMDKALQLLQSRSDRFPQELDAKMSAVRDLLGERFKGIELQFEGIQLQFKERDTRVEQTARDSKTAVDAALQAAKEAVEKQNAASSQAAQKSEGAFTKQIDQLAELFRTGTKSLEDKIIISNKVSDDKLAALNERITRIESVAAGLRTAGGDNKDSTMMIIAIIGAGVGIVGLFLAFNASQRVHSSGNGKNT